MTRRCGNRIAGGIYLELGLSKYGQPIEHFLCDPAILLPDGLDIPDRGMVLHDNILFDHIGISNDSGYPHVLDFIEEVRAQGLSRRIQSTFDFSSLNESVRYCAIHPKGYVENESWYREYARTNTLVGEDGIERETPWPCPKGIHSVNGKHEQPCSAVWWHDLRPSYGEPTNVERIRSVNQPVGRPYMAMERPKGIVPIYSEAIVLIFPVLKLAVIKGADGEHKEALKKAEKVGSGIQVTLEDA